MDLNKYVDISYGQRPPMLVEVIDQQGKILYTYDAPAGFQLDLYVQSLFPYSNLMVSETSADFDVSVAIPGENDLFQIHHGVYLSPATIVPPTIH